MSSVLTGDACGRSWSSRSAQRGERRREHQFYRYYGPFRQIHDRGPTFCDVRNPHARSQHKASSSPDQILTAFCQLGALRMQARRALIFFFDVNHAYIMAEATRTLSLENDNTHDANDQLWMGYSVIPRDVACCEVTVNLPSFPVSIAKGDARESVFVVDDLTKHPDLRNRAYVTEFPHARWYAGVPITTKSGINIGAYCILDDKPRKGVSEQELVFLRDMSQTVMTHLETVRALAERQQNVDMVSGLGNFIRGSSSAKSEESPSTNLPLEDKSIEGRMPRVHSKIPDALVDIIRTPLEKSSHGRTPEYFDQETVMEQQRHVSGFAMAEMPTPSHEVPWKSEANTTIQLVDARAENHVDGRQQANVDPNSAVPQKQSYRTRPPLRKRNPSSHGRNAYQRAAEILCQSLHIDGVAFLDASVGTFGGITPFSETSTGGESDDSASVHSDSASRAPSMEDTKACKILGCAQTVRNEATTTKSTQPVTKLTESFVRKLLRHYPNGMVWTFDEDLVTHYEDGQSTDSERSHSDQPADTQRSKPARTERRSDSETLQSAFPGARCIALHGIRDHMHRRWSVGGLYWTYEPLRVLCMETEMRFIATFCDVVVVDTVRLDVMDSDKAKSGFLSSISHELRSPLHGILGSAEILAEHELTNSASTMVEQINSCGRTLLSIIDHLLDFENLKQQHLRKGAVKSSRIGRKFLPSTAGAFDSDLAALNMEVLLDDLTEDVVVSSVYSYHYNREIEKRAQTLVILDIERSHNNAWGCQLATGGWKRICVNLITNALKYTPVGFVRVSLKQRSRPGARRRFDAVLSVTDSGIGMSEEFQKYHLFRDFAQEDTLASGLGIGMHMVSSIVNALGGKIDVASSQKGSGTRVTVTVPLELRQDRERPALAKTSSASNIPTGLVAGMVVQTTLPPGTREEDIMTTAWTMAAASIEKDLKFLGVQLERCAVEDDAYDLRVIIEPDLDTCLKSVGNASISQGHSNFSPMLVICSNTSTAHRLADSWSKNSLGAVVAAEFLGLPCGTKRMGRAISSLLKLSEELKASIDIQPQDTRAVGASGSETAASASTGLYSIASLSARPSLASEDICTGPAKLHGSYPPTEEAKDSDSQLPAAIATLTHLLKSEPLVSLELPEVPLGNTNPSIPAQAPKGPVLLLVDDNNINLQLLTMFAKKRQYPYITAVDGQLAFNAFVSSHEATLSQQRDTSIKAEVGVPQVILMDINMPVMDGYEAVQRIRAYEKKHHLASAFIVAITALNSEAAHAEAFGSGFNMFLSKPIKLKDLTKIIETAV